MTDDKNPSVEEGEPSGEAGKRERVSPSMFVVLLVVVILTGVIVAKIQSGATSTPGTTAAGAGSAAATKSAATITSAHNDALADYEAALRTGKPVYLLFHSLSCQPCVEISAVVDKVMPDYRGKVVFVNALSEDAPSEQLASKFRFQYIPTSFFLKADGTTADSFTGSMSEADMRARLDKLVAQ